MSIDWSKEFGATHCDERARCFYKLEGDTWKLHLGDDEWCKSHSLYNGETKFSELIEHPKQPQAWSGPEDGLPPVGTVCEFAGGENCADDPFDKDLKEGAKVTIIAHFKSGGFDIAAFIFRPMNANRGECSVEQGMYGCFRPIRTPEQLAAEERERAIDSMVEEIVGYFEYPKAAEQYLGLATRLHDKGFKREGK